VAARDWILGGTIAALQGLKRKMWLNGESFRHILIIHPDLVSDAEDLGGRRVQMPSLTREPAPGDNHSDGDAESSAPFWDDETPVENFSREGISAATMPTTLFEPLPNFAENACTLWK